MKSITDTIYDELINSEEGLNSVEIVKRFMKIENISHDMAEKIVSPILKSDSRFVLGEEGNWKAISRITVERLPLNEINYVIFYIHRNLPETLNIDKKNISDPYVMEGLSFISYKSGYTRIIEDIDQVVNEINSSVFIPYDRSSLYGFRKLYKKYRALPPEITTLSIREVIKALYPDRKLKTWEDLVKEFSIVHYDSSMPYSKTKTAVQVLEHIISDAQKRNINTLEDLILEINKNKKDIDFKKFSFDRDFIANLPELPGVYIFKDRENRVIYVGKTLNLRRRINSYFWNTGESEQKIEGILKNLHSIAIKITGSELEAIIDEYNLIKKYNPEFNTRISIPERIIESTNRIVVLPSAEENRLVLLFVSNGLPLIKYSLECGNHEASKDLKDLLTRVIKAEGYTFDPAKILVLSYLKRYEDNLNIVEIDEYGNIEKVIDVLKQHCNEISNINTEKRKYLA